MRLLLMLLISQAIYDAADLGRQPGDATGLDAEKVVAQDNEAKGREQGEGLEVALIPTIILPLALNLIP